MTSHNRLTYNNHTQSEGHPDMTSTATLTASPVLDFDVIPVGRSFRWTVFDARALAGDLDRGNAPTMEAAVIAAMGAIADRTPGRVYAVQTNRSWCVRLHGMWAPLPLTPAATEADVFAYCNDVIARGRSVEVCDVARLARHFA